MPLELVDTVQLPDYSLNHIFNGDSSGLEDNDIKAIDEFCAGYNNPTFNLIDDEPGFTHCPEFGLPCNCYETEVYEWRD